MRIGISLPVRELGNDLGAIRAFAQAADELGYTHLRVPDLVLRPGSGGLHEPMMLLAWVAAITENIELVPSVIVLPSRQTALFAKQAAELDVLSGGRLRLGIGVGGSGEEYAAMNQDFHTRGARIEEQIELLKALWTIETVEFEGRWDSVQGSGLDPLPVQRPIPLWIGARGVPAPRIRRRIGRQADGWFVLCSPEDFPAIKADIDNAARQAGRDPGRHRHGSRRRRGGAARSGVARAGKRLARNRPDPSLPENAGRRPRCRRASAPHEGGFR